MTELLSCPFCGGEAELHASYDMDTNEVDGWFAWCNNDRCECKPETNEHLTEAEAIAAWNTRAERTCRCIIEDNMNDTEGMGDAWATCSECGMLLFVLTGPNSEIPNYCPNCGAKVVNDA